MEKTDEKSPSRNYLWDHLLWENEVGGPTIREYRCTPMIRRHGGENAYIGGEEKKKAAGGHLGRHIRQKPTREGLTPES